MLTPIHLNTFLHFIRHYSLRVGELGGCGRCTETVRRMLGTFSVSLSNAHIPVTMDNFDYAIHYHRSTHMRDLLDEFCNLSYAGQQTSMLCMYTRHSTGRECTHSVGKKCTTLKRSTVKSPYNEPPQDH